MNDVWSTPPTEEELKQANGSPGVWDTPPTADEVGIAQSKALANAVGAAQPGVLPPIGAEVDGPAWAKAPEVAPAQVRDDFTVQEREREYAEGLGQFLHFYERTTTATPEGAMKAWGLAKQLGYEPQFVLDHLAAFEGQAAEKKIDWAKTWLENPNLRPILEDPVKALAIRDESADLNWFSKWIVGGITHRGEYVPPAPARALWSGVKALEKSVRQLADEHPELILVDDPGPELMSQNKADTAEIARVTNRDYQTNLVGKAVLRTVEMLPSLAVAAAAGAATGGTAEFPALAKAAKGIFWASQGYGNLAETLKATEGPGGEKLGDAERHFLAASFSLLGGAAMEWGFSPVSKGLGLEFAPSVVQVTGRAAIENPSLLRVFGRWAWEGGKAVATGAAAMGATAALNESAVELSKSSLDPTYSVNPGPPLAAGARGFVEAIPDMLILGFWGPSRAVLRGRGERILAQTDSANLLKAGEAARRSKLRERFTGGYEDLVRGLAADSSEAVTTVYATAERFDQVARARGADPREMAAAIVGDNGAAWDRAQRSGLALEIPVEKYLVNVAVNPELEKQLLPDLRIDRDGRTLREATEQQQRDLELMRRVQAEPITEDDRAAQAVKKDMLLKAVSAGRPEQEAKDVAELVARVYRYAEIQDRPRALAAGEKPWTSYDFYTRLAPIEIAGWKAAELANPTTGALTVALSSPDRLAQVGARSEFDMAVMSRAARGLLERARTGDQAAVEELFRLAYTDALTSMYSPRAHLEFITENPDPGGVHVYVDLPGLGLTNNKFGQSVGNEYIGTAGRALREAAEAAGARRSDRAGGDEFYFVFGTPEGARSFIAGAQERFRSIGVFREGWGSKGLLSFYAGIGASPKAAELQLNRSKVQGKAIHGDSKTDLAAIGHGEFYVNEALEGARRLELEPREVAAHGLEILRAAGKSGGEDRGAVVFTPLEGGQGVKASITLLSSDPSTLAHETAHVFGRLLELLATREGATETLKADYRTLLRAMDYATPEERAVAREERARLQNTVSAVADGPQHQEVKARLAELNAKEERLSYLWEQYLQEGKAPAVELAGLFARFRSWLTRVYRSVTNLRATFRGEYGEELGALHPETKALFDRLLTVEREAAKAQTDLGLEPLPDSPEPVRAAFADARAEAEQRLLRALAEADRGANAQMMKDERERLRSELAPGIDADPVQAAVRALQGGGTEVLTGPGGEPLKLNRKALTKAYGAELTRSLAREHPGIFGPKGEGMKAEDVAQVLGFENGADLVRRLAETGNRDALLEQAVGARMRELYGKPLIEDPTQLADQALEAAATPKAVAAIIKEMSRLAAEIGGGQDVRARGVNWDQMVRAAGVQVQQGRVADLSPAKYRASMAAASRRAFEAMQRAADSKSAGGKASAARRALEERDQQLWAFAMMKAAEKEKALLDQRFAQITKTGKAAWRSELGKADPAYRDAHDTILTAVGISSETVLDAGASRTLDQAIAKAAADAADIDFDPAVVRGVVEARTPWNQLTVEQAWEVSAAVQNLRTIANNANSLSIQGRRIQRAQVLDRMEEAASRLPAQPRFADDPRLADSKGRTARLTAQAVDALLMDVATVAHILDGGNRDGIFHQVFIDQRLEARDKRLDLTRRFLQSLAGAFEKSGLDRSRLYERVRIGDGLPLDEQLSRFRIGEYRTRANLLMMALNLGNASNAERFLGGYGWERQRVLEVLQRHLNANEWRWVQSVWNALEGKGGGPSLYEEMAEAHEVETGLRPEKIQPTPFRVTTADGEVVELQGGYFPARYDPRPGSEKKTGEKQLQDSISAFFSEGYQRAGLKPYSPHSKARAEHFQDVVNLDWGIVPQHVSQVIQDIAYRRYARQTAALILDSRFQNLMAQRFGEERARFFGPWLQAVVNASSDSVPADLRLTDRVMSNLKGKAAIASIGWSIPVALGDLTNPLIAMATGDVAPKYLALATAKIGAGYPSARRFVLENSPEVRMRAERLAHHFAEELGAMGGRAGAEHPWLRGARETAFVTMEISDRLTTTPVWLAKYQQASAEGMAHPEAVRAADDLIRKIFPPEEIATKPRILRAKGLSSFLLFYGYANKIWNVERVAVHDAWAKWHSTEATGTEKAGAIARAIGTIAAVSLVNGVIGEYFSGRGKTAEEETDEWIERKLVAALFYPLPFVGALGDWVGGKAVAAAHGKEAPLVKASIRNAPALSFVQDTAQRFDRVVTRWASGDAGAGEVALHSLELMLGLGVGAPLRQVEKTGKAAANLATGETQPAGPVGAAGNLVYGESDQANPLADLQQLVTE